MMMLPALFASQSALDPGGANAARIFLLGKDMVFLLGIIFIAVIVMAFIPLGRRHRGIEQEPLEHTHRPSAATERKLAIVVSSAVGATVLVLLGLVVVSVLVGKSISNAGVPADALTVEVTGNQWWWYVRYLNDDASKIVVTANELHIPVGRPVVIRGTSNDVIHSFWIPGLQGKRDLIPSRVNMEWIVADHPGRFRGQCAEFCGLQHAHMAMWVVAEPETAFDAWMSHQTEDAVPPATDDLRRGQQVFLSSTCVFCHHIQGTDAAGQVGPDLTHFGSRLTIAAGTLPNNKGNLAGWIADPQSIKPGTKMATVPVKSEDMQPLIDYLESLQ
ncbi:MAG TPA: c-type cytochrome [Bryobacteraceae bacterium]|nr:c-type cytochrome [Bryobacteraceae bacterium]